MLQFNHPTGGNTPLIEVKFIRTNEKAILPTRNHKSITSNNITGDTGYDLYAVGDVVIPATRVLPLYEHDTIAMDEEDFECSDRVTVGNAVVPVGLQVAYIQDGYYMRIEGRSGLGFKSGIQPHFGIIDNQYRGDLSIKLYNLTGKDYQVKMGDRIAQAVFYPIIEAKLSFSAQISETTRSTKGFGSSGL